ncbi:hypothetical protein P153DRAFT_397389 [Dothidotthia symphoricarpi CBS 119687]|uniref:DUF1857-domain-containing protein n=1 Tax=Dothidotthia symphoricarpi CBS 119687 TaxID=1392245 RepID=A0A6A6A8K0_9PLEO|nr:uncharacterized protein P153DRAFT_397389 [Dothidotthia symphoricarpi CBS 119687]KAF2128302.1 hypothetical protein P153DRAFT_397389 [Dothidotthia symphoricarpi CBS 119687]
MPAIRFNFNVAYSEPVNRLGDEPVLSMEDVWHALAYGCRRPEDMAEYVASSEITEDDGLRFHRRLILGGGAVHTAAGETIEQDVILRPMLNVEATTTASGATTIFAISQGTSDPPNPERPEIFLTGAYELWMDGVEEGSKEATDVRVKYGALAKGATQDGVKTFRRWKVEGKLDEWAKLQKSP